MQIGSQTFLSCRWQQFAMAVFPLSMISSQECHILICKYMHIVSCLLVLDTETPVFKYNSLGMGLHVLRAL